MKCEDIAPYLPGLAGGEIGDETVRWVRTHLERTAPATLRGGRARHRRDDVDKYARKDGYVSGPGVSKP